MDSLYLKPDKNHEAKLLSLLMVSRSEPTVKVVPKLATSVAGPDKVRGHYPYNFGDTFIGPIYKGPETGLYPEQVVNTTMNTF